MGTKEEGLGGEGPPAWSERTAALPVPANDVVPDLAPAPEGGDGIVAPDARGGTAAVSGAAEPPNPPSAAARAPAAPDTLVFRQGDRWRGLIIHRLLGMGFSGQVYEVRHEISGEHFALKVMHLADRGNAAKLERSLAEAEGTFGIEHRNVVEVLDIGCDPEGMAWILMELLEGMSLRQLLGRQGRLSPLFALWIATEAAWGLDAAHENQIIHRDVKPENIFLTREGIVKVLDFSIAKHVPYGMRTTQRNVRLGTAAYMSPENVLGKPVDARFDVYALGMVLREMLGGHPFADALDDPVRLMKMQINLVPPLLSEVAGLPIYVDELIRKMIHKDPDARFLSVAAAAQAMIAAATRLREDAEAGRIVIDVPPGEPAIAGKGPKYFAPTTRPETALPARAPSAKVVVAAPAAAAPPAAEAPAVAGPKALPGLETVPLDVAAEPKEPSGLKGPANAESRPTLKTAAIDAAQVREIVEARWYAEKMPKPSGEAGAAAPSATRTTAPVVRIVAGLTKARLRRRTKGPANAERRAALRQARQEIARTAGGSPERRTLMAVAVAATVAGLILGSMLGLRLMERFHAPPAQGAGVADATAVPEVPREPAPPASEVVPAAMPATAATGSAEAQAQAMPAPEATASGATPSASAKAGKAPVKAAPARPKRTPMYRREGTKVRLID